MAGQEFGPGTPQGPGYGVPQGPPPGFPQPNPPRPGKSRRRAVRIAIGTGAGILVLVVLRLIVSGTGSSSSGSSTPAMCTSARCINADAQNSLLGFVAKDQAVATKVACQPSTVKANAGGTWTVACKVTESDGAVYDGNASVVPMQGSQGKIEVTYEILKTITPPGR